ncbi:MAG: FHA domain-containing protein [Gemmatimonadales bacterium]
MPYVPPLATFLVRNGALAGQRLGVWKKLATIGRGGHNDVRVPDETVGMSHARVELRQGIWFLTPLGSSNRTRVDGETAGREMPLSPGSVVQLGDARLFFEPRDRVLIPQGKSRRRHRRRRLRLLPRLLLVLAILLGALLLLAIGAVELR